VIDQQSAARSEFGRGVARNIFLRIGDRMPIFVEMPSLKLFAVVVVLAVTAGCWSGKHGMYGNSASFGNNSHLYSQYVYEGSDEPVPVCHVLFVPQWDPPPVDYGFQHGGGGDERKYTFRFSYAEQGVRQFEAQPVTVVRRHLFADVFEGGGRRFDLGDGNILVVAVDRDGSVRVSQVPRLDGKRQPSEILAAVKKALPKDARVQALKLQPWAGRRAVDR